MHFSNFLCLVEHLFCRVMLPARGGEEPARPQTVRGIWEDTVDCVLNATKMEARGRSVNQQRNKSL